ncbi:hypothetical protein [uncultured Tateyamaria sp.]|uniref:hypothetical protein n=1 Tax=uncultured Tateyamaria sp. TaxID=455651 RepID=UPI0026236864|nr:hypothetical protein [uncultured Tateyamaria sp.]
MMTSARLVASLVAFASIATSASGVSLDEIRARDFNNNGYIENGAERDSLRLIQSDLHSFQLDVLRDDQRYDNPQNGVLIEGFDPIPFENRLKARCDIPVRFFLRDSLASVSVLQPGIVDVPKKGAAFSYTYDQMADEASWSAKGVFMWLPAVNNRCHTNQERSDAGKIFRSGVAFAPFVAFDGTGSDSAQSTSNLKFGIRSELQYFGGFFNAQHIAFNPFFGTDFDFDAEVYGLNASWTPILGKARLNGFRRDGKPFKWSWTLVGETEYQNVNRAGQTGLTDGTEYGWIGGTIGLDFQYSPKSWPGLFGSVKHASFRDAIGNQSADLSTVTLGFHLDKEKTSALKLIYENGEDRTSLTPRDRTTLALTFAF